MSHMDTLEEVIEEVSDWAVEIIQDILNALMPDGRPFMKYLPTEEDRLIEYYGLRNNPEAWTKWVAEQAANIIMELQDSGVDPEAINSVHPPDIAARFALIFSLEMEELISKGLRDNAILTASRTLASDSSQIRPA